LRRKPVHVSMMPLAAFLFLFPLGICAMRSDSIASRPDVSERGAEGFTPRVPAGVRFFSPLSFLRSASMFRLRPYRLRGVLLKSCAALKARGFRSMLFHPAGSQSSR
jgi:hypothetical protein